jgi:hypothetical protein
MEQEALRHEVEIVGVPKVDLLLCFPDMICSAFVVETLIPLITDPAIWRVICRTGMRSEYAREALLQEFLKGEAEWVFIVDTDMILPPDALKRLLRWRKKMVTGLYFGRGERGYPVIFTPHQPLDEWPKIRYFEYPQDSGLIEVGATGHGCLLIHRSVIEAMKPPYSRLGPWKGEEVVGSDVRLCMKARKEAGVKIWCDTSLKCGHLRPAPITEDTWLANKEKHRAEWEQYIKSEP